MMVVREGKTTLRTAKTKLAAGRGKFKTTSREQMSLSAHSENICGQKIPDETPLSYRC
jgi:hypothetical protein